MPGTPRGVEAILGPTPQRAGRPYPEQVHGSAQVLLLVLRWQAPPSRGV